MANVMFKKGLVASLPSTYAEGTFYVTTDERAIYLDISDSARIRLGDFIEVANTDALPTAGANVNALYYVTDINCLAKWDGAKWIQINRDTGMTSVEVTGEGNAVTAAVYSADGRKLTLTKGATFATKAEHDTLAAKVDGLVTAGGEPNVIESVKVNGEALAITDKAVDVLVAEGATNGTVKVNGKDIAVHGLGTAAYKAEGDFDAAGAAADAQAAAEKHADDAIAALKLSETYEPIGAQTRAEATAAAALDAYKTTNDAAVAAAKKAGDDAMAEAQKKVASVAAGDASVTVAGTATAPTVAAKLSQDANNALELAEDGLKVVIPAAAEYTIEKAAESGEYAAVYALKKDGVQVGASINIPKDMVVESGSVVENPEGQAEGTYIKLVLQNVEEPLYINVGSLIEYVTSGSQTGDMVVISVSDDHKVTATITDGSITLAKLATDVQTAIGKAHSHENAAVLAGITEQNIVDWNDAVTKEHEHANKDELDLIASGDKAKWDAAEAKAHEHTNKTILDGITDAKVAAWDAAEQNAKDYADGLAGNYATKAQGELADTALQPADIATGSANGTISVEGADVAVKGLGSAAYTASTAYDAAGTGAAAAAAVQGDTTATVKDAMDCLTWGSF